MIQRLPVRIRLDPEQDGIEKVRPGMSVEPTVVVFLITVAGLFGLMTAPPPLATTLRLLHRQGVAYFF